jgi:hypothetical protein
MLGKIKGVIRELIEYQKIQVSQLAELEYANIFHETIKNHRWLEECSISPGRWAGNYSFFYILSRILLDYKPKKILELGLGESSKFISSYIKYAGQDYSHLIVEHNSDWVNFFSSRYSFDKNTELLLLELENKKIKGKEYLGYKGIETKLIDTFDLYLIDGPFGSDNYSRYDICLLSQKLSPGDEFVIILDDHNRQAEQETGKELIRLLESRKIKIYSGTYSGNKSQLVVATDKYQFCTSL